MANAVLIVVMCLAAYAAAYFFYSRFLSSRVISLEAGFRTPAHELRDGIDYVPTNRYVLFGHHFASIAGLMPILGPAVAMVWGWVPALLWVVFGTIFIGAVHDYTTLVLSTRNKGQTIGTLTGNIIGPRARILFLFIILFFLALAMGIFVLVISKILVLRTGMTGPDSLGHPLGAKAVFPSGFLIVLALISGFLIYRKRAPITPITIGAVLLSLGAIGVGSVLPIEIAVGKLQIGLLMYALIASVLPVWVLLQPRDYLNSFQLYLAVVLVYAGLFLTNPTIQHDPVRWFPAHADFMIPFLFITVACGAVSGFHNLVASGTTARQLNSPGDARFIGYGGMLAEGILSVVVIMACAYAIPRYADLQSAFVDYEKANSLVQGKLEAFLVGSADFLSALGIPNEYGRILMAVVVLSFGLTTLDSGTRLLRYNVEAIGEVLRIKALGNRYLASLVAVLAIGYFAFTEIGGEPAGISLLQLFGTTNQLLAG